MAVEILSDKKVTIVGFKEWTTQQLKRALHLVELEECSELDKWLAMPYEMSEKDRQFLQDLRKFSARAIEF